MNKLTVQDVLGMISEVANFNLKMDNSLENKKLIDSYHKFTHEEYFGKGEYLEGVNTNDAEMSCDGMADLVFTTVYWALLEGYNPEVDVRNAFNEIGYDSVETIRKDLEYSIREGLSFYAMNNLILLLTHEDTFAKFDILGAFNEVARSNNSKFVLASSVDVAEEVTLIETAGRYGDITVTEVEVNNEIYLAFKAGQDLREGVTFKAPKMIKASSFSEPSLAKFIK